MNTNNANRIMTRRQALDRLSAGTLLTLGLWPGALAAEEAPSAESFCFIVVNDTHCMSQECGPWLERVVEQMKREKAEFCLHCGDWVEKGERGYLEAVKEIFAGLALPIHSVIGNHDYLTQTNRSTYLQTFQQPLNYHFQHRGWQFIGLDTSEGQRYENTTIQPETLRWVDAHVPHLDRRAPTVIFTHFPLNPTVKSHPANADALLERFREINLQAVFSGHFHGFTESRFGSAALTTNRCCALKRSNHDGTKEKGYFVCTAREGRISRTFVECKPA